MLRKLLTLTIILACFFRVHCSSEEESSPANEPPVPLALKSNEPGPPVITEQPKSKLVEGSETVRLYCHASGNPTPKIRWLKDGLPLERATVRDVVLMPSGGLTFIRVRGTGEGSTTGIYQCIATNEYGSVASQNASIEIASIDDQFRKEPIDTIAAVGQSVTLQCQGPRGIPEPEITWQINDKSLTMDNHMEIRPGGNLYISQLQHSDTGSYVCVASNVAGERTSSAAVLKVKEVPRFTARPSNTVLLVGDSMDIQCRATGDPKPRIKWSKRRGKIPRRFIQDGNVLRVTDVALEDHGIYTCTAINNVGKESTSFNITIQMKAKIVRLSDHVTSLVGSTCTLTCEVDGRPRPTIRWRDPKGLEMSTVNSYSNGRVRVSSNGDLMIENLQFVDQGQYTCQASNSLHTDTANTKIIVTKKSSDSPPPIVSLAPPNATLALSSNALLKCEVINSTIQWFKDGKPVRTGFGRFHLLPSGYLKINNVQKSDAGLYICVASNQYGIDEWKAWIKVKSGTDLEQTNSEQLPKNTGKPIIVNSTSDCITVTWTLPTNDGFPVLYYVISYYRIGSTFSTWERVVSVNDNVRRICDLQPSSEYVLVTRGVNELGVGWASPISDLMLTKTSSFSQDLDYIFVNITRASPLIGSPSIRLQWKTNATCDTVDGFMVISKPVRATSSGVRTGQVPCSARSYELVNLNSNTKYEVRIRPLKKQRAGVASPIKFITPLLGLVPSGSPALAVKKDEKNPEHVMLQWQPPRDLPTTYVIGYVLRFRSRDGKVKRMINVNATDNLVVKDLPGDATYDVTVTYKTQLGEGLTSDPQEIFLDAPASTSFMDQPVLIVALAGGVLVVLAVVGVSIYCCCKKSRRLRKTSRFQVRSFSFSRCSDKTLSKLSSHNKSNRYNPVNYNDMFDIKAMTSSVGYSGASRTGPDLLREGQRGESTDMELTQLMQSQAGNFGKSNVMTYTSNNGQVRNQIVGSPVDEGNYPIPATGYALGKYPKQDTARTQFVKSPTASMPPPTNLPQQFLFRQLSHGSGYSGSNPSDVESRRQFYTDPSVHPSPDLPPPPPTPPVSLPHSSLSQRSRTSSGKRSTASQSSRSGHRSRQGARFNPNAHAGYNFAEESETEYGVDRSLVFQKRPSIDGRDPSSFPPTPPTRDDSHNHSITHSRMPCNPHPHFSTAERSRMADQYHESGHGTDQLGQLHSVRHHVSSYDPRNSANVSNFSMMNGYGSESDARESLHDHRSVVSTSSDVESFHMESVSQVGQNFDDGDTHPSTAGSDNFRKRSLQRKNADILPKRTYPSTFHHYPLETCTSDPSVNPGSVLLNTRKNANKSRETKAIDRTNSASSCASSYHQNTGDSGMSAGVNCSTEHSSLNSHASAGSGNKTTPGYRTMPSSVGELSLPRDGAKLLESIRDNISPLMNQSGYCSAPPSAAHSRNNSPAKPIQPRSNRGHSRLPVSLHRPFNHMADSRWCHGNSNRIPLSPIQSPDQENGYVETRRKEISGDLGIHHSSKTKEYDGDFPPAFQELSDVPEVSTSDFCEDFDDASQ